jgi:hypothetical protein
MSDTSDNYSQDHSQGASQELSRAQPHAQSDAPAAALPGKPKIMWLPATVLIGTFIVAVTVVPWYGMVHGYSLGNWLAFLVLLFANGLSITAG